MIKKDCLVTKADGTKCYRYRSDKAVYLQRISTGEKFAFVVCSEDEIVYYFETTEKISPLSLLKERLGRLSQSKPLED